MPDKVKITKTKLDNLANAVAAKSGQPVLLTVDQMTDAVLGINLGEENILEGVKVNNVELPIIDKKVNIPAATVSTSNPGKLATVGVVTQKLWDYINEGFNYFDDQIDSINNAGYDIDEKVKQQYSNSSNLYPVLLSTQFQNTTTTDYVYKNSSVYVIPEKGFLHVNNLQVGSVNQSGEISLGGSKFYGTNNGTSYTVTLPAASGTVALTSDIPDTSSFLTSETDPTVPSWAKASTKPSYNFSEIGSTPTTISGYGITDAYTKTQVDGLVAGVLHYKGTKAAVSNLPTSGNTTGDTWHITADGSEWAWDGTTWQELGTAVDLSNYVTTDDSRLSDARTPTAHNQALSTITGADDLKAIEGLTGTSGLLKKTAANTWTLDTSNYLTSYTETDPVFSASAAAGITSTDISNWNAKVSDDKTWNGVRLDTTVVAMGNNTFRIPFMWDVQNETSMRMGKAGKLPAASQIAMWDDNSYLYSTTPSTNDNSTKVATTAYVDAAIPNVSGYISNITYNATNRELKKTINGTTSTIVDFGTAAFKLVTTTVTSDGSSLPTSRAVAEYVDNKVPKVYSSTNTNGYLTMATLPIYDGTVV